MYFTFSGDCDTIGTYSKRWLEVKMGILINACTIVLGGLLGSLFGTKVNMKSNGIFGICVLIISAVGVIENMFDVSEGNLESDHIFVVVFALMIGCVVGDWLRLEERLSNLSRCKKTYMNAFIDATLFFGVGGLQICGPILLALQNDSSQLYLKSMIDFPFAFMFGAVYGKTVILSCLPVAGLQLVIAVAAYFAGPFISDAMLGQLCSIGYIILFFSGFNLLCEPKHKIKNINMIPAILIILLVDLIGELWR